MEVSRALCCRAVDRMLCLGASCSLAFWPSSPMKSFFLHCLCNFLSVTSTVEVVVKARKVKVTGKLGQLERDFKHICMECRVVTIEPEKDEDGNDIGEEKKAVQVDLWFASKKQLACVRTVCSHIENMIVGVTRGFTYTMRAVYSHFPINISTNGNFVEIRNFLGERRVRKIELLPGVKYVKSETKDQIELTGIDITMVSLTAANIQQATNVRNKDLRKFLDGVYVSEKGANAAE
jgi:large subunit ribosomal protein L9e